ncbi:MAG: archaellar assembly protein FlaJ [Methanoregulaceae archaeon]|nr:archaellar assembly protein FlaJ [Methanoregulaceae archaeon]
MSTSLKTLSGAMKDKNRGSLPFKGSLASIRTWLFGLRENKRMGADLLFMITYMAAITTARATRPEIFAYTATREEFIPSKYFKKIEFFVKRWNYSYVDALTLMAERVKNPMLQSMLNRYANSIESGVPDEDFLTRELLTIRSIYRNTYEEGLEMLKKWGDAYIAMLFSASLVGIIIMISVAIFAPEDIQSTLMMSYLIVIAVSIFGIVTMYRAVPDDQKTHGLQRGSKEQGMIHRMSRKVLPVIAAIVITFLLLSTLGYLPDVFGLVMLIIGILLFPLGIIGYIDDSNIILRDSDFSVFIRSLGSVMGGKGVTIGHAMAEIDKKSLVTLEPLVNGVFSKLNLGLDDKLTWERFIGDSGSNLIYKYLGIFRDSVELGGSPDQIGEIVGSSMLEQVLLRNKRHTISLGFVVLLIPMHAMMIAIFLFLFHILLRMSVSITDVMQTLGPASSGVGEAGALSSTMSGSLTMFVNFPEATMITYVMIIITIITVSNILAGRIVFGGAGYIYYFFGSLLCTVTGIIYIAAPFIVGLFFNIPTLSGV